MPQQDPKNIVRLLVSGQEFAGWKSVRIEAGIERQARSFELSVTDKWPGNAEIPRRIRYGDACQVFIGNDLVMTGYVDATPVRYDGKSVTVGVKGRSKTADLVDCCPVPSGEATATAAAAAASSASGGRWGDAIGPDGKKQQAKPVTPQAKTGSQWRNVKMEVIAAALAAPYGVRVLAEVDTGRPIPSHVVQVGETVFESIDRMMRIRHVLSTDNEHGDLVFVLVGSGGQATTALELGKNILSGDALLDYTGVFSQYIVKGQRAGSNQQFAGDVAEEDGDEVVPAPATVINDAAIATDPRASRRRVLVIKQSGQADEGTCKDRAEYERAHRAAKALQTSYTVTGWRQDDGSLWLPNQLVKVRDGLIGFDDDMLIAEVAWILDANGQRAEVRVGPPDGYRTKAGILKASKSQKGGGPNWSDVK